MRFQAPNDYAPEPRELNVLVPSESTTRKALAQREVSVADGAGCHRIAVMPNAESKKRKEGWQHPLAFRMPRPITPTFGFARCSADSVPFDVLVNGAATRLTW